MLRAILDILLQLKNICFQLEKLAEAQQNIADSLKERENEKNN